MRVGNTSLVLCAFCCLAYNDDICGCIEFFAYLHSSAPLGFPGTLGHHIGKRDSTCCTCPRFDLGDLSCGGFQRFDWMYRQYS